jgi:hypothetical protein
MRLKRGDCEEVIIVASSLFLSSLSLARLVLKCGRHAGLINPGGRDRVKFVRGVGVVPWSCRCSEDDNDSLVVLIFCFFIFVFVREGRGGAWSKRSGRVEKDEDPDDESGHGEDDEERRIVPTMDKFMVVTTIAYTNRNP